MIKLPEIIVGGFPNSGTSFLCNLIVQLGKCPGSARNLKGSDSHNRWGYFEHLPIRKLTWSAGGWQQFRPESTQFLPDTPLSFSDKRGQSYRQRIQTIAQQDGVEIYKDNALPLIFRLFPISSKYIIIERDIESIYMSPQKSGGVGYECQGDDLLLSYKKYMSLVHMMNQEVDCLTVRYEQFSEDYGNMVGIICQHLQISLDADDQKRVKDIFRPRELLETDAERSGFPVNRQVRVKKRILGLLRLLVK